MAQTEEFSSISHLFSYRVQHTPNAQILVFPDKDINLHVYTYRELDTYASSVASYFVTSGLIEPRRKGDHTSRLTVGLLAASDLRYIITELALLRLGYCILLLSPNNAPAAIAHLLQTTGATHAIVSPQFQSAMSAASDILQSSSYPITVIPQPTEDVFNQTNMASLDYPLPFDQETDMPFAIIHSSGSTGFPKPIITTHRAGVINASKGFGMNSLNTLPLCHASGHANVYRAMYSGSLLCSYPTGLIPLTASSILSILRKAEPPLEALLCVPYALKALVEHPDGIDSLRKMRLVTFTGSPLSRSLGVELVDNGVRLVGNYGLTEISQIGSSLRDFDNDKDWDYLRISNAPGGIQPSFEDQGDGTFELVFPPNWPGLSAALDSDGRYHTKDLFQRHPSTPNAWRYCGRLDDTLVMANGEKTNPLPIELALRSIPDIMDAIVFGAGQDYVGALIVPPPNIALLSRGEYLSRLAPALDKANSTAPSHSQLALEHLVILPTDEEIPRSDKGSILRPKVYKKFEKEIASLYLSGSAQQLDISTPKTALVDLEEVRMAIQKVVYGVLGNLGGPQSFSSDLFELGVDSVQSTRIRNGIQRTLELGENRLPSNFVFENPTVEQMTNSVMTIAYPVTQLDPVELMLNLVTKYTDRLQSTFEYLPQRIRESPKLGGINLCLTGATGSLGSHILSRFMRSSDTQCIWCLVRADNDDHANSRVAASMSTRGLGDIYQKYQGKIKCLAADFKLEDLGLKRAVREQILQDVSIVIHAAWPVNFNMSLSSFIPHIGGAVHLLKFTTESVQASKFYFVSSVGVVSRWDRPSDIPEEVHNVPTYAQDTGYAQSKWVIEMICQWIWKQTDFDVEIFRVGQLVGDTIHGIWNESEVFPLIMKATQITGFIPSLNESVRWLPVDQAADVIFELSTFVRTKGSWTECPCWHVIQPHKLAWPTVLDYFSQAGLQYPVLDVAKWLDILQSSSSDPSQNPATKLESYFTSRFKSASDSRRTEFAMGRTLQASTVMQNIQAPEQLLFEKFVAHWKLTKFLR